MKTVSGTGAGSAEHNRHRSTTTADRRAADRGAVLDNLSDDDLPTEAEIADLIRQGKTGAIIEAICRDLGLVPGVVSEQQWKEVAEAISTFGGKFVKLFCDILFRIQKCIAAALAGEGTAEQRGDSRAGRGDLRASRPGLTPAA